ncbi:MAG: hypothetical protein L6Q76_15325, partial [Polyangiaceae bacterium]|nr:hypothetical protein [Polyangiaceae bacterium]
NGGVCGLFCVPDGKACMSSFECCSGLCNAAGVCGFACQPDGAMCGSAFECCSGQCTNGVCGFGCQPDGAKCGSDFECCSGLCNNGVCGLFCQPDGAMCGSDFECCSGQCSGGVCGPPACPSDGSACGDCLAQNCCDEFLNCAGNPGCLQAVACFTTCIANGGGPVSCAFQCQVFGNQGAFQLISCAGQNCGGQCP